MVERVFSLITTGIFLFLIFVGCSQNPGGTTGGGGGSTKVYGGASPIGDYIAVTLDTESHTATYTNYTTGEGAGPYSYSKLTANNWGFQNIYKTENFTAGSKICYAKFILMEGVALIFQLFETNDEAVDWPVYALCRKAVNMSDYKGKAFNWMNFKINSTNGNFEAGFAGVDTDSNGFFYGASYNNRAEKENWSGFDKGMKTINDESNLKEGG